MALVESDRQIIELRTFAVANAWAEANELKAHSETDWYLMVVAVTDAVARGERDPQRLKHIALDAIQASADTARFERKRTMALRKQKSATK